MLNSIKKYIKKAKEEVNKEYSVNSPEHPRSQDGNSADGSSQALPRIWTGVDLDGTLAYYNSMKDKRIKKG